MLLGRTRTIFFRVRAMSRRVRTMFKPSLGLNWLTTTRCPLFIYLLLVYFIIFSPLFLHHEPPFFGCFLVFIMKLQCPRYHRITHHVFTAHRFHLILPLFKGSYPLSFCLFDVFRVICPKLYSKYHILSSTLILWLIECTIS